MKRLLIIVALAVIAGCSGVEYQGVTPSVRTMADTPGLNEYYVGGDLRFAITDPDARNAKGEPVRPAPPPKLTLDEQPKPLPPPPIP